MPRSDFSAAPPKEALDWFRAKKLKPGFNYRDVWREEHATSFTVAKAMQTDILNDIRAEVDRALAEGRTFRDFAKDLKPTLQKKGWWGKQEMVDPLDGKKKLVQLGSPRRLKVIYRTNMRTARSAGQWERIQRTKEALPYLLYSLGPSREHRPEHVGWHGTLLPVDHDWWKTHYPPNGWGCKCRVRQISGPEAKRLGRNGVPAPDPEQEINPDTGLPTGHLKGATVPVQTTAPEIRTREWINKRSGEVHQVPEGIDPGWDYNPGRAGRLGHNLKIATDKLEASGAEIAAPVIRDYIQGPPLEQWMRKPQGNFPIGMMKADDAAGIGAKTKVVQFSPETLAKQRKHHPELQTAEYEHVQDALEHGERIQDSPRNLIYLLEDAGYVTAVKATKSGEAVFLSSFRRLSRNEAKRDAEVIRLRKKNKSR